MNQEHVVPEQVLEEARKAFSHNQFWIAYNTISFSLEDTPICFFKEKCEALEFSDNNISEYDDYRVIYARSLEDMLGQINNGELFEKLNHSFKNKLIMNEKNYDYLSNQLKYTGFGEELNGQLKEKMQKNEPNFTLTFQKDFGKDESGAILHFKKSEESDMYFFNRYTLMMKNDQHPDAIKQNFYINPKGDNITLKEGYNLLNGRSVHKELANKEGEKYNAWVQLDFKETDASGNYKMKQYHENYKYDLAATLSKHPIRELQNESDAQRLMESLQRGNRQSVTMTLDGKEQKVFIEAVPQFKSLNIYDASNQRLRTDKLYESNSQENTVKEDRKQSLKHEVAGDEAPEMGTSKPKRRKQTIT